MKVTKVPVETNVAKLRKISEEVDLNNVRFMEDLKSVLLNTFKKLDGKAQGISAIQCGMPYCAVLLRYVKGKEPIVIFNPVVLKKIGHKNSNEACLSEGDIRYIVQRPLLIKVRYVTTHGNTVTEWLPYKKARIFMHEYDHLQGILLQDKGVKVRSNQ